jgi:hypothetical protein
LRRKREFWKAGKRVKSLDPEARGLIKNEKLFENSA